MKKVSVKVTMQNGTGLGLFIRIDESNLFFSGSGTQQLNLAPQFYIATVGGHEPSSAKVKIEIIQNGTVIGTQSFDTPTFFGFIPFTVN